MAYDVTDITELIRYHLVLAEPNDERADDNLIRLVSEIERMATRPRGVRPSGCSAIGAGRRWTPT